MNLRHGIAIALAAALAAAPVAADTLTRSLTGFSAGGQAASLQAVIDFTPTGGDYGTGAGTATVLITLENTSGLYPFQTPSMGNPILTGFYFNLPTGANATLVEARALAGATLNSTGTTIKGIRYPRFCETLTADRLITDWYALQGTQRTGQFGIFSQAVETVSGNRGGLVDPEVFQSCVRMGAVCAPLVVAGRVRYTVLLDHLPSTLYSAQDFLNFCSTASGTRISSSLGGHFQGVDRECSTSTYLGDACQFTPTATPSWGSLKATYHR